MGEDTHGGGQEVSSEWGHSLRLRTLTEAERLLVQKGRGEPSESYFGRRMGGISPTILYLESGKMDFRLMFIPMPS
jgi:hypothetical protein